MAENVTVNGSSRRKHIREPPSVPFLWEDRPGVAKKDWRPTVSSVTTPTLPSPVKLIASVPFIWEEKPGKPLSFFSEPSMVSSPVTPPVNLISLPSPPKWHNEQKFDKGGHDQNYCKGDELFNLDLQSFSFETEDSFNSAHSLSANCLVSTLAIAAAVPVLETSSKVDVNAQLETPSSPASESDSSTSSYATGISSLTGSSFLECLFPLYARSSSFPGDVACAEESYLCPPEQNSRNPNPGSDDDLMARRAVTLGELIMMSRRRSCQRKTVQIAKQNLSMEFINKKAFGCCIFGAGINMLAGLQRKRQHLLKLL